jgi:hypothetical protein
MEVSRFVIPVERNSAREKIIKKKKGINLKKGRFGTRKNLLLKSFNLIPLKKNNLKRFKKENVFPSLKDLLEFSKEKDLKRNKDYDVPLIESTFYTSDEINFYLKTGLKQDVTLPREKVSIYGDLSYMNPVEHRIGNWMDLRFSLLKKTFGYFFRGRWYFNNRLLRRDSIKHKEYEYVFLRDLVQKKELTHKMVPIITKGGIPLRMNKLEMRNPRKKKYEVVSSIYFLRERFFHSEKYLNMDIELSVPVFYPKKKAEITHYLFFQVSIRYRWKFLRNKRKKARKKQLREFLKFRKNSGYLKFSNLGKMIHEEDPAAAWWNW